MKVFLYGVLAVGMRHYGSSELIVGDGYYLRRDRNNPYDENAVAIVDRHSGRKKASLKRDSAALVAGLFDEGDVHMTCPMVLKPKAPGFFLSRSIGVAQRCNAAFKCDETSREAIERRLHQCRLRYRIVTE